MGTDLRRTTEFLPVDQANIMEPDGRESEEWIATSELELEYEQWEQTIRVTPEPTYPHYSAEAETDVLSESDRRKTQAVSRMRQIASLIASNEVLVLTLLAFISSQDSVRVDALVEMGGTDELFGRVWDLWELGLIERIGGSDIKATPEARRILAILGLHG